MVTVELPNMTLDYALFDTVRRGFLVFGSLLCFWIMASATTSKHPMFHYEYYPSLTFFVWVGVLSFLYAAGVETARHVGRGDLSNELERRAPPVLLWLTYTAAIAASATSSDLHATFDVDDGPVCRPRASHSRAASGASFCSHVVGATVLMYFVVAAYALTIAAGAGVIEFPPDAEGGAATNIFSGSTGYDEVPETKNPAHASDSGGVQMNI
mmetsp:Transcript_19729/g.60796  ORF Transcript_19729/g.60796 Transcript_19729/m.60796 type:complete len:212 (+) Transcript_19729:221-856(+)